MLTCPKCGHDNELGRIFCHQCGAKLDLDQIKPPSRGGKSLRRKREFNTGRAVSWLVRLAILGALVWVIVMILQPPVLKEIATQAEDVASFSRKQRDLEDATGARKAASITLTEAELNAYLDHATEFVEPTGSGVRLQPTNIQIEFGDGQVTAYILGKIRMGASYEKAVGMSYTAVPVLEDGQLKFQPVAARLGKLPIGKPILDRTSFVQGYFKQVFQKLDAERSLLQRLSSITVAPDGALLDYQPESKPAQ